jgi:amino acid transporter
MSTEISSERTGHDQHELKRVMGPKLLLLFIVGDILGAGVYAVTGDIAGEVGGVAWLPFLIAFTVATLTAFSYLELVTKYPQAAGAALYTHKAFGVHFVTFLVAFTVVCSGITSASTSSNLLAANLLAGLDETIGGVPTSTTAVLLVALGFMLVLAAINLRGVGESVKFNVVLTLVEITALAIVILIGFWAMASNGVDVSRVVVFENASDRGMFAAVTVATAIAFFSMVGFEDSVNMVEECHEPEKIFPRTMLTGLGIAVVIYMLVAVSVVMVLPIGDIQNFDGETGILLEVVKQGAPGFPVGTVFPFLTVFAVANTALINMLMASRLIYGMARQDVLPRSLGPRAPRTSYAVVGDRVHHTAGLRPDLGRHRAVRQLHRRVPGRHDRSAAAGRLHHRQRRLPGAAPRHHDRAGLQGADRDPGHRGGRLCLPHRTVGP